MLNDGFLDISIEPIHPTSPDAQLTFQVEQFLFREASLLDERAFDGWLALWAENGRYWVPRAPTRRVLTSTFQFSGKTPCCVRRACGVC